MSIFWTITSIILVAVFAAEMYHSLRRSDITARLVREYGKDLSNPRLTEEIYAYCLQDRKLRRILDKHHATKEDLTALKDKLTVWGNFQKGRRLVPINSFFYVYSLNYLLTHKNDDPQELAVRMMNFFHI